MYVISSHKEGEPVKMRITIESQSQPEETQAPTVMNPEMWVQLSVEQHQKTSRLLEEHQHQIGFLLNTV